MGWHGLNASNIHVLSTVDAQKRGTMPEEEKVRREPNLKRYTPEEKMDIFLRAGELLEEGKKEEATKVLHEAPLDWRSAKILKETIGIEAMLALNCNLSEAVDHFGMEWLER